MEYLVDAQGFKQPGDDYIVKELAILPLNIESDPLVKLFAAPFPWRRLTDKYKETNTWLERHYHGLNWNSGDVPYGWGSHHFLACLAARKHRWHHLAHRFTRRLSSKKRTPLGAPSGGSSIYPSSRSSRVARGGNVASTLPTTRLRGM